MSDIDSAYVCPRCGSADVIVEVPTWYRQTRAGGLVEVRGQPGEVSAWYCNYCHSVGDGAPEDAP
jgi:hypothetical protein